MTIIKVRELIFMVKLRILYKQIGVVYKICKTKLTHIMQTFLSVLLI